MHISLYLEHVLDFKPFSREHNVLFYVRRTRVLYVTKKTETEPWI